MQINIFIRKSLHVITTCVFQNDWRLIIIEVDILLFSITVYAYLRF